MRTSSWPGERRAPPNNGLHYRTTGLAACRMRPLARITSPTAGRRSARGGCLPRLPQIWAWAIYASGSSSHRLAYTTEHGGNDLGVGKHVTLQQTLKSHQGKNLPPSAARKPFPPDTLTASRNCQSAGPLPPGQENVKERSWAIKRVSFSLLCAAQADIMTHANRRIGNPRRFASGRFMD